MRIRLGLAAANLAALAFSVLTFSLHGAGFHADRLDLDVYRIGSLAFLRGGNLYHGLPPTGSGVALPFTYPPFAAVLLSPLAMVPMTVAAVVVTPAQHHASDRGSRCGSSPAPCRPGRLLLPAC